LRAIPVDSADALELREIEAVQVELAQRHREACMDGILGEDAAGHQVPCPQCRPHLYAGACRTCLWPRAVCAARQVRPGRPCCDRCQHAAVPSLDHQLSLVATTPLERDTLDEDAVTRALLQDYPVTQPGSPPPLEVDRLLLVTDPVVGAVRVRWRFGIPRSRWKCSSCGPQDTPQCAHTFAGAMFLATALLGLQPIDPTDRSDQPATSPEGVTP
jgi:hypothetical protein